MPSDEAYSGPAIQVSLSQADAAGYAWKIEAAWKGSDVSKSLRYRAAGYIPDLTSEVGQYPIEVRDFDREVWTPMPISHRKDIRVAFDDLLGAAISAAREANK